MTNSRDPDEQQSRQILPVANLPENFSDEPADGLQYLFTVRRDARKLPHITRVRNPYEQPTRPAEPVPSSSTSHPNLPSAEWQAAFLEHFSNLRKNSRQETHHIGPSEVPLIPAMRDRERWWAFLCGQPPIQWVPNKQRKPLAQDRMVSAAASVYLQPNQREISVEGTTITDSLHHFPNNTPHIVSYTAGSPIYSVMQPREPTPKLLGAMDERTPLHLLMYFNHWITVYLGQTDRADLCLTETHAHWMFALLSRVDDYVSADDMALLRSLARSCMQLIHHTVLTKEDTQVDRIREDDCWMIITAIIGTWSQRDLWSDAEKMLFDL